MGKRETVDDVLRPDDTQRQLLTSEQPNLNREQLVGSSCAKVEGVVHTGHLIELLFDVQS